MRTESASGSDRATRVKELWAAAPSETLTSGIGSLPYPNVDSALEHSLKPSIPFLPQIPIRRPQEFMIAQALEGLPGLEVDDQGTATLNFDDWENGFKKLADKLDSAFENAPKTESAYEDFEPGVDSYSAWKPFLYELDEREIKFAKVQIAGPLTCQWALKLKTGELVDQRPEVTTQVFRLVLARSIAMIRRLKSQGVTPFLLLDEPSLYILNPKDPQHLLKLQEIRVAVQSLQKNGAIVGIHCCSNTAWESVLSLGTDVISIDSGLSFHHLCSKEKALKEYLDRGGRLSLGVIPTNQAQPGVGTPEIRFDPIFENLRDTLDQVLSDSDRVDQILKESVYTPACGLALHSPANALMIQSHLFEFAKNLEDR